MSKDQALEFVAEGADSPNYLGSPAVVAQLVSDFCTHVHEWAGQRGSGSMAKDEFIVRLKNRIDAMADIFMGRNGDYVKIVGWNSDYGLGVAAKQSLGEFWGKYAAEYDNDPGKALFGWLAASVVDAGRSAADDPDLYGAAVRQKMDMVVRLLLGLHRRR